MEKRPEPDFFEQLVEQFSSYPAQKRMDVARRYGAVEYTPLELAKFFVAHLDLVREVVEREIHDSDEWDLVYNMIYDHSMVVKLPTHVRKLAKNLEALGLVTLKGGDCTMAGAIAAILAPFFPGTPNSGIVLLGTLSSERLEELARYWEVKSGSYLETIIGVANSMVSEGALDRILGELHDPEYLSAPLMALEFGGLCFWQEVFGFEAEENSQVVPMMRRGDLELEIDMASELQKCGLIFKVGEGPHSMLVVPEEFWEPLWELGLEWLSAWMRDTIEAVHDSMQRLPAHEPPVDPQGWIRTALLVLNERKSVDGGELVVSLTKVSEFDEDWWSKRIRLLVGLTSLGDWTGPLKVNKECKELANVSRSQFYCRVLDLWCSGERVNVGEKHFARAMGLDESWRQVFGQRFGFDAAAIWMLTEGVEPELTGAGFLKDPLDTPDELLNSEYLIAKSIVAMARQGFLDLLSREQGGYWYPVDAMVEVYQMVTSYVIFVTLGVALDGTGSALYIPFQRPSLMNEAGHTDAYRAWFADVLELVFVPLGLAVLSDDREWVWFDTQHMITSTLEWEDEESRIDRIRKMTLADGFYPRIAVADPALHKVPVGDQSSIGADAKLSTILNWVQGQRVKSYDGRVITFE